MQQRELVERARSGDLDAFDDLARASITRLYAIATLILRDTQRAQDAVQDALLAAWQDSHAIRDPDAWDAWLHRLTVRACYKVARRERRRIGVEVPEAVDADVVGIPDHASLVVERDRLDREVGRLPIDQRAVMVVHYYLDQPISVVAEILDIPVGTAKSRLHHGLAALRHSIGPETDPSPAAARERPA
jgi:RNA polymerase sigma-70 factor (ECF subfamily)